MAVYTIVSHPVKDIVTSLPSFSLHFLFYPVA